jgi:chemotaxis protein MotB
MSNAFGVQREVPSVEPPMGTNIIAQNFKTSRVDPILIVNVSEETMDTEPTEEELKSTSMSGDFDSNADVEVLKKALAKEIARGQVEIRVQNESIVILTNEKNQAPAVNSNKTEPQTGGLISADLLEIYAKVAEAQSQLESEVFVGSNDESKNAQDQIDKERDQLIDEKLERVRANLKSEIAQGKANVERIGDQILVQLSAQDSFRSGFAELRSDFLPTLSAMARTIADLNSKVTVSGHTDNIPVGFSDRFLSNWDLSAARAAAVADYLLTQNAVTVDRIDVVGFADTKPTASNSTQEGRSQNRRIELLIDG